MDIMDIKINQAYIDKYKLDLSDIESQKMYDTLYDDFCKKCNWINLLIDEFTNYYKKKNLEIDILIEHNELLKKDTDKFILCTNINNKINKENAKKIKLLQNENAELIKKIENADKILKTKTENYKTTIKTLENDIKKFKLQL